MDPRFGPPYELASLSEQCRFALRSSGSLPPGCLASSRFRDTDFALNAGWAPNGAPAGWSGNPNGDFVGGIDGMNAHWTMNPSMDRHIVMPAGVHPPLPHSHVPATGSWTRYYYEEPVNIGLIVGLSVGGAVLLVGLLIGCVLLRRRRRRLASAAVKKIPIGGAPGRQQMRQTPYAATRAAPRDYSVAPYTLGAAARRERAASIASSVRSTRPAIVGMFPANDSFPKERGNAKRKESLTGELYEVMLEDDDVVVEAEVITETSTKRPSANAPRKDNDNNNSSGGNTVAATSISQVLAKRSMMEGSSSTRTRL